MRVPTLHEHCNETCQLRRFHNGTQHELHAEHEGIERVLYMPEPRRVKRL